MGGDTGIPRGRVYALHYLVCGVCGGTEPTLQENHRDALAIARLRGWERKRVQGWVCPEDLGNERGGDWIPPGNWPGGAERS
jgi:hypothetical protein